MEQRQQEVPLSGARDTGMGPCPSPTPQCPALHHTGTGAARCSQGEGSGTSEGPAGQSQQVGGARDPVGLHLSSTVARATRACTGTQEREVWEQPRQKLGSRGVEQASWRQSEGSSAASSRRALPAPLEVEAAVHRTHSATAGECAGAVAQQLEVWAIDEMVEATEAQLERGSGRAAAARGGGRGAQRSAGASARWREQGASAWCGSASGVRRSSGAGGSRVRSSGAGCSNEPGGLRGVAGVGERPVSERHMPDFVSEAEERGKVAEAEGRAARQSKRRQ